MLSSADGLSDDVMNLLHEQPTVEIPMAETTSSEWILCSERLPKTREEVIICTKDGFIRIAELFVYGSLFEPEWYIQNTDENLEKNEVIAWMPLPESYKEVEND